MRAVGEKGGLRWPGCSALLLAASVRAWRGALHHPPAYPPPQGGPEMAIHHVAALASVATAGLQQQGHNYTLAMLATEMTTPFVNLRWLLDKAVRPGLEGGWRRVPAVPPCASLGLCIASRRRGLARCPDALCGATLLHVPLLLLCYLVCCIEACWPPCFAAEQQGGLAVHAEWRGPHAGLADGPDCALPSLLPPRVHPLARNPGGE